MRDFRPRSLDSPASRTHFPLVRFRILAALWHHPNRSTIVFRLLALALFPRTCRYRDDDNGSFFLNSGPVIQFIRPSPLPWLTRRCLRMSTIYFIDDRVPEVMKAIRISSTLTCHSGWALPRCLIVFSLSCKHAISCVTCTAVPFGGVVRRLRLLTYNTSQLRTMRVVVL